MIQLRKKAGIMECNTLGCIKPAKYMIIQDKETVRYCISCIRNMQNRSMASDVKENVTSITYS